MHATDATWSGDGTELYEGTELNDGTGSKGGTATRATATVLVLAAAVGGAGTVAVSPVLPNPVALLVAVLVLASGLLVARPARTGDESVLRAVGPAVLRGVGGALAVLGGYLLGLALLGMLAESRELTQPPSAVTALLVLYGAVIVLVLGLSLTGQRPWHAPAGALLVLIPVFAVVGEAAIDPSTVAVVALVLAIVLAVPVVRLPGGSAAGNLLAAAAATATTVAYGAGASPLGYIGASQVMVGSGSVAMAGLPSGWVIGIALLVAGVLVLVAVARKDIAGGILAGTVLVAPPANTVFTSINPETPVLAALWVPPLAVVVLAGVAIGLPRLRSGLASAVRALGPSRIPSPAACAAASVAALTTLAVLLLPVLDVPSWLRGLLALGVVLAATGLGATLSGVSGTVAAVAALLGSRLASPWTAWLHSERTVGNPSLDTMIVVAVLDLLGTVALCLLLLRRHRRPAVYAASAYTIIGGLGAVTGTSVAYVEMFTDLPNPGIFVVLAVTVPLLVIAVPAAIDVFQRPAVGQAVGAVVLAAAAFIPLKATLSRLMGTDLEPMVRVSLSPLTPSEWSGLAGASEWDTVTTVIAVAVFLVMALIFAASLARRPSAPLAAAVALTMLVIPQTMLLVLDIDVIEIVAWCLGGLAVLAAAVAMSTVSSAVRRQVPGPGGRL